MNALPADVSESGQYKLRNVLHARVSPAPAPTQTFKDYLSSLPYHQQCMMGRIRLPFDDGKGLADKLREGTLRVMFVSDGSVRAGRAAHLWVIKGRNR